MTMVIFSFEGMKPGSCSDTDREQEPCSGALCTTRSSLVLETFHSSERETLTTTSNVNSAEKAHGSKV